MRIAVTGATGLIGTELVPHLLAGAHTVVRLVRREPGSADEVRWDPTAGEASGIQTGALDGVDAVVHLAGAGVGDKRWTESYKATILNSRVLGTRTVVAAMEAMTTAPKVFVSASAVGYYGDRGDEELTESSPPGTGFLADVVQAWEAEAIAAETAGIRVVRVRTGLVMTDRGGAFERLLPLIRLGLGGPLGSGRQWWPWVTLEDEVRAIAHCLENPAVSGAVNVGSPNPLRNVDVTRALGVAAKRPTVLQVPGFALRVALGEFSSDVTSSQRMVPTALRASGFEFSHPDIASAAAWLMDS